MSPMYIYIYKLTSYTFTQIVVHNIYIYTKTIPRDALQKRTPFAVCVRNIQNLKEIQRQIQCAKRATQLRSRMLPSVGSIVYVFSSQ